MLTWFECGGGKGCVREEFPYRQKPRKDYRLEAEWEKNAIKVLTLRTLPLSGRWLLAHTLVESKQGVFSTVIQKPHAIAAPSSTALLCFLLVSRLNYKHIINS